MAHNILGKQYEVCEVVYNMTWETSAGLEEEYLPEPGASSAQGGRRIHDTA